MEEKRDFYKKLKDYFSKPKEDDEEEKKKKLNLDPNKVSSFQEAFRKKTNY